jgi:REP element-mobilizing transposase RayT
MADDRYKPDGWYDRGYLPHYDSGGPTFVTFRLNDSLPRALIEEVAGSEASESERRSLIDGRLDDGLGECVLVCPGAAEVVSDTLRYFDGDRYRLHEWVVMPNHVHVLIAKQTAPLREILHSWKSYTSHEIQKILPDDKMPEEGTLWQPGYYDRSIRDRYHFWCVSRYILLNPVKAGLSDTLWGYPWSSAAEHDETVEGPALRRWFRQWSERFDELVFEERGGSSG